MSDTHWFVVVGNDKTDNGYRMAYQSRTRADLAAAANDLDYPLSGPWRVIPLVELKTQFYMPALTNAPCALGDGS